MDWGERFVWIVDHFHGGNRAEAARQIGVTRQAMARLCDGATPGGDTLAAVSKAYPGISDHWLLHGTGAPLRTELTDLERNAVSKLRRIRRILDSKPQQ